MLRHLSLYGQMMQNDPLGFVIYIVTFAVAILASLILHECAHGYVALWCGDPTAKMMGRLSLRPSHHLDPLGTIFMLALGFGWARPVPVNPRNFRHYRRDDFLVSIAGIITNLTLFLVSMVLGVLVLHLMVGEVYAELAEYNGAETVYYVFMNSLLDGTASSDLTRFIAVPWLQHVLRFLLIMGEINLSLAVFNLLPIPPLDGYHLVNDTLLRGRFQLNAQTFRIFQIVLLVLCFSGLLGRILGTVVNAVYTFVVHYALMLIP